MIRRRPLRKPSAGVRQGAAGETKRLVRPLPPRYISSAMAATSEGRRKGWMSEAVSLGRRGMRESGGGPFGAIVVGAGEFVGRGCNQVTTQLDPTAHAEILAIRAACQSLGRFDLRGCELYTSCEPCPMCLAAIYWARLDRVFYACTRHDAA